MSRVVVACLFLLGAISLPAQQCIPNSHLTDTSFGGADLACGQEGCWSNSQFIDDPNYPPAKPDIIKIGRVVTDSVDTEGKLINDSSLVANGVVSPTACVSVRITATLLYGAPPPSFTLMLNDTAIWNSRAAEGDSTHVLEFPISSLHFAKRSPNGPTPGENRISMLVTGGSALSCWHCGFTVHLGPITFKAMAPIMLVHGTRSGPWWFGPQAQIDPNAPCGTPKGTDKGGFNFIADWVTKGVPFACKDIQVGNELPFVTGANNLLEQLIAAANQFGSKHIHIVAHSNGGNWARTMLASPTFPSDQLGVYSLTTISTPFSGTVLADEGVAGHDYLRFQTAGRNYVVAKHVRGFGDLDRASQTWYATRWNLDRQHRTKTTVLFPQGDSTNYPQTNEVKYFSSVANADVDNDWKLDSDESTGIQFGSLVANARFQELSKVDRVIICDIDPTGMACPQGKVRWTPKYENTTCLRPNDTTLTVYSGAWPNPLWPNSPTAPYFGLNNTCFPNATPPIGPAPGLAAGQQFQLLYSPTGLYWPWNHTTLSDPYVAKGILDNIQKVQPMNWGTR